VNYELPAELWSAVVPVSLLIGAIGGLIWEIGNAVRRSQSDPELGLGNTIELPRWHRTSSGRTLFELGVLGPMAIGAVSGVLLVLLVGAGGPGSEEVAKAVVTASSVTDAPSTATTGTSNTGGGSQPSPTDQAPAGGSGSGEPEPNEPGPTGGSGAPAEAPTAAEATEVVEEELSTSIGGVQLISLALLGGLAGWGLIQSLTTRLSDVLEAMIGKSAKRAGDVAKESILAADPNLTQAQMAQQVGEKVEAAASGEVVAEPGGGEGGH
jgi:hypothetical protein